MENLNLWLEKKLVEKGILGFFKIFAVRGNVHCVRGAGPETTYYDKVSDSMNGGSVIVRVWGGKSYRLISKTGKVLSYEVIGEELVTEDLHEFVKKVYKEMGLVQKILVLLKLYL